MKQISYKTASVCYYPDYRNYEHFLSIEKTSKDEASKVSEFGMLKEDYEKRIKLQEETIVSLTNEVQNLKKRMASYEDFTQWFMGLSPDELEDLGRAIKKRRFQKEQQEAEQEMMKEFKKEHPSEPMTEEEIVEAGRRVKKSKVMNESKKVKTRIMT